MAHFALTNLLLPTLKANAPARIVVVSSICHDWHPMDWQDMMATKGYEKYKQYSRTKLMNHMMAFALARRLQGSGVTCNVLEPGVIQTKLLAAGGYSGASVESGAVSSVHLAQSPEVEGVTGKYFNSNKRQIQANDESKQEDCQERLWKLSEEMCTKFGVL